MQAAPPSRPGGAADERSLGEQIAAIVERLPENGTLTLSDLLAQLGDEGLLVIALLLTLVFLIPVSIPGVSTVFGAGILLIGVSRLSGRPLWVPARLARKALPAERLRPGLIAGLDWVRRLERISRPYRLRGLVEGRLSGICNDLAFILAALLLMAPFGFVPFSNTLPALALLFYAVGFIQRDGGAVLLGHLANVCTMVYFSALIGGGGLAVRELLQRFAG